MRRLHRALGALTLIGALAASGCLRDPDPITIDEQVPTVHAVLVAGADGADVLIAHAGSWNQQPYYVGITGADVRLVHGADTVRATEDPDRPCARDLGYYFQYGPGEDTAYADGCYHLALPTPVAAGDAYELLIGLPSGRRVTGHTIVPVAPAVARPEAGLEVTATCGNPEPEFCYGEYHEATRTFEPVATLPLEWERATGAEYSVRVYGLVAYLDGAGYEHGCELGFGPQVAVSGTGELVIPNITCREEALHPARFDSIQAEAMVATLGDGYAAYLDGLFEGQTVRESAVSEGLDGAYGVFAAVAPVRRPFTVVRTPPPPPPEPTTP